MSFMRSPYYVWHGKDGINLPELMAMDEFDALVVMRMAELVTVEKKLLPKAIKKALRYQGNFGCDALCRLQGRVGTIEQIRLFAKALKKKEKKNGKNVNQCS